MIRFPFYLYMYLPTLQYDVTMHACSSNTILSYMYIHVSLKLVIEEGDPNGNIHPAQSVP